MSDDPQYELTFAAEVSVFFDGDVATPTRAKNQEGFEEFEIVVWASTVREGRKRAKAALKDLFGEETSVTVLRVPKRVQVKPE